jgi:hypothetical protein
MAASAKVDVVGTAPISFTDSTGAQKSVLPSALTFSRVKARYRERPGDRIQASGQDDAAPTSEGHGPHDGQSAAANPAAAADVGVTTMNAKRPNIGPLCPSIDSGHHPRGQVIALDSDLASPGQGRRLRRVSHISAESADTSPRPFLRGPQDRHADRPSRDLFPRDGQSALSSAGPTGPDAQRLCRPVSCGSRRRHRPHRAVLPGRPARATDLPGSLPCPI